MVAFDKACLPSSVFRKDVCKLESFIRCPGDNCTIHRWRGWYDKAFSRVLAHTHDAIKDQAGGIEAIRLHRSATSIELKNDKLWRKQCQGAVYSFLVASKLPDPCQRVRYKIKRWRLPALDVPVRRNTPARNAIRVQCLLNSLGQLVPPRVQSAVFGAIWNRWTTARRFQRAGACLLCGGEDTWDSIEHYSDCKVVKQVYNRKLRLHTDRFANLHSFVLSNPYIDCKETLIAVALLVYGVYDVTNRQRILGSPLGEASYEAVCQAMRTGARGHQRATHILDSRWCNNPAHTPLAAEPLVPFSHGDIRWRRLAHVQARKRDRHGNAISNGG